MDKFFIICNTNIVGNTMFGALSGSAVAASIAVGGVMLPEEEGPYRSKSDSSKRCILQVCSFN